MPDGEGMPDERRWLEGIRPACNTCDDTGQFWNAHAVNGRGEHAPEWQECPDCA